MPKERDGENQELGQGGFLVLVPFGELEPLGLQSLELVISSDVGSHKKGLCVKRGGAHDPAAGHPLFVHTPGVGVN